MSHPAKTPALMNRPHPLTMTIKDDPITSGDPRKEAFKFFLALDMTLKSGHHSPAHMASMKHLRTPNTYLGRLLGGELVPGFQSKIYGLGL